MHVIDSIQIAAPVQASSPATVTLVGAGPGDPELITVKGLKALQAAQCVLYDHLVSPAVLDYAPACAQRIYVGKQSSRHTLPQDEIIALMIRLARAGTPVLRLKGGDGYIFGRGGEEAQALAEAGIPFRVVAGLTAAQGAAASVGIPLTHRDHARSVVFATGHLRENQEVDLDWSSLAKAQQTVVIYMGIGTLPILCERLQAHGLAPDTPAALIEKATLPEERCVTGTLGALPALAEAHQIQAPALIMIGTVVGLSEQLRQVAAETIPAQ